MPFYVKERLARKLAHVSTIKEISKVGYSVSLATLLLASFVLAGISHRCRTWWKITSGSLATPRISRSTKKMYIACFAAEETVMAWSSRRLRCPRNNLHLNLFVSFVMRAAMFFLKDALFVAGVGLRSNVEVLEGGLPVFQPQREYGRSTSMICSVLKRKESIKSVTPAKGLTIISKLRTSLHENMEKLLMVWVTEKQLQGDTLTQTIICHRKRRQFKQTDAFTRGMVIGLKRAGWSIRQIAADTHLGASTVHRLWRRWLELGNVAIYRNVGATRVTSARVDRRILRQAVAAPQATCTAILQHVQDTLDHSISTRTISRRLVANGLHSCRPLRRLPLTPPNRRQRLEWCRARSTWMTEWHRVVFSDESRFCLSSDSRRVCVWRRRGERSNPAAIVERPTVRQRGIMVWGAIAYDSRSPLLRIQGTMTAQRYVDDVLRPVTLPYLQGVPNALYQQDNARPHTARISQQALQDVQMLPWPPYSPDLSPIEHVWDIIGRRLHALPQPRSEDELWQMVEREWRAIPQDAIRTLIDSLPRRVAACIAVRGGPTCY
ncbi:Transposase [Cordylochernes scorpioides]|uniref:Transposase n=1 Tax=Cordylochernes scorpioides TaxID=51811 RepID=A0ABY6L1G8_9ARAC|nr:Transposase [Cordylochernes scorpioides]